MIFDVTLEIFKQLNTARLIVSRANIEQIVNRLNRVNTPGAELFIRPTISINIIQSPETSKDDGVMV